MYSQFTRRVAQLFWLTALITVMAAEARADAVTDWNRFSGELITEAKLGTPPAIKLMAVVQTAAFDAARWRNDAAGRGFPASDAAVAAAIAAAHRVTLGTLLPAQRDKVEATYGAAIARLRGAQDLGLGISAGEEAARAVLAARSGDGAATGEAYRPHAAAGAYVPSAMPAALHWPQRRPWLMSGAAQFRPAAPPALGSDRWARDYNEVRLLGAKASSARTAEQTEIARFWEYSLPAIYFGIARSLAEHPSRDVVANARLYAAVAQAMDDAMISVFDAKYHHSFWRPVTAIRNGDLDGNSATERDAGWTSFIEAPLHPEYPSAHSILAAAVGTVVKAESQASGLSPVLSTSSPTARGASRQWRTVEEFVDEVADARIYEGIHFRSSTRVGIDMGRRIGELAVAAFLKGD